MEKTELKEREDKIEKMAVDFCNEKINAEYAALCKKMVRKLGRKKTNPLGRGRLEIWAAMVVYTVGKMNFLFDKSFEPYLPLSEINTHFGVSQITISQKANKIREMLDLCMYFDPDFSTKHMNENNPFNNFFIF